jgi:hypothetical protein
MPVHAIYQISADFLISNGPCAVTAGYFYETFAYEICFYGIYFYRIYIYGI